MLDVISIANSAQNMMSNMFELPNCWNETEWKILQPRSYNLLSHRPTSYYNMFEN